MGRWLEELGLCESKLWLWDTLSHKCNVFEPYELGTTPGCRGAQRDKTMLMSWVPYNLHSQHRTSNGNRHSGNRIC